ncbi:MAG: helix-turn-helix domain-containing protein [Mycobacteriales bacterium]|nr:helix-turn-helix domain-containing protein [Mycobacteriales bacterium]
MPSALPPAVLAALREELPPVAGRTVAAVIAEVPEYADAWQATGTGGGMATTITHAVELALATFLRLAERPDEEDGLLAPALDAAYALGRGEARDTRTMEALLSAYRVGSRAAWRDWSATAVAAGVTAEAVAAFAELVFAYIDSLSAASAAGHADELAKSGRVREKYLERLATALLAGDPDVERLAELAQWSPPETLTAVVVPAAQARSAAAALDGRSLALSGDVVGLADQAVWLAVSPGRPALLATLRRTPAVVGPTVPWAAVAGSFQRAERALELLPAPAAVLDTDAHLAALVVGADPSALADLRAAVLAPMADLRPAAAERLEETLRSWLLHQGRREAVAAELHVHPQTVRYRVQQLRELYGDALTDPAFLRDAVIALTPR